MLNTALLKEQIRSLGLSQRAIASALGLSQPVISQKLRGLRPLYLHEAKAIADILRIEPDKFSVYFFIQ